MNKIGFAIAVYEAHPDGGDGSRAFLTLASNGVVALLRSTCLGRSPGDVE